jgi:hypothetical protein
MTGNDMNRNDMTRNDMTRNDMSCKEWRRCLTELSRGHLCDVSERHRALAHAGVCNDCRRFFEAQSALTAAETAMASEIATLSPPPELEDLLLAEFSSHARRTRRDFRKSSLLRAAALGAIAAALAIAWLAMPRKTSPQLPVAASLPQVVAAAVAAPPKPAIPEAPKAPVPRLRRRSRPSPSPAADTEPFIAIPYTLPLDPRERAAVVRMEMPVAALAAVGLRVAAPDSSASAQADVIVGEDGRMRAIRLLSISNSNPDRSIHQ